MEDSKFDHVNLDPVTALFQTMSGLAHLHSLNIGKSFHLLTKKSKVTTAKKKEVWYIKSRLIYLFATHLVYSPTRFFVVIRVSNRSLPLNTPEASYNVKLLLLTNLIYLLFL